MKKTYGGGTALILCLIVVAAVSVAGCRHRSETRSSLSGGIVADDGGEYCTGVARPAWVPKPNMEHPDVMYATGVALQAPSRQEGRALAFRQGAGQLTKGLCDDISLQQDFLEAEYCERHGSGVDYYVLVALPRTRYETLKRRCDHTVIVGTSCDECPDNAWAGTVAAMLSDRGLQLAPQALTREHIAGLSQGNRETARSLWDTTSAAVAVTVTLTPEKQLFEDDVYYVYLRAQARITDLETGTTLHTLTVPAVKGAAFDRAEAWKKATGLVMRELRSRLAAIKI